MGRERLIMVMENAGLSFGKDYRPELYIAPAGDENYVEALKIATILRKHDRPVITDIMEKSLKAQMKYADKCGAENVVVIGADEIRKDEFEIKNLRTKECKTVTCEELINGNW